MNAWYFAPAGADIDLLHNISDDLFEILPMDLAQSIRISANYLATEGKSDVHENGLPLDYPTLIGLAVRFADSGSLRDKARNERVQRNRYNHLYRA